MSLASSSAWAGGRVPEGPARGWKGGIAGRSPVVKGADRPWKVCPVISAGEEGLLAFGGGCPLGVCGEGRFWPLLGGVEDIVGEKSRFLQWFQNRKVVVRSQEACRGVFA